jgi:GTP-binding protein
MNVKFLKSAHTIEQLPKDGRPEIVLVGRSNVGKSSFINSFFNRRNLAQTSSTPGKTRAINFYDVDGKLYFADLPGFGYAKVGAREAEKWKTLIEKYLYSRRNFLTIIHFVDSRLGMTDLDLTLNYFMNENGLPFIVVLTKADKLNNSEKKKAIDKVISALGGAIERERIFLYSATKKIGKNEIKKYLNELLGKKFF